MVAFAGKCRSRRAVLLALLIVSMSTIAIGSPATASAQQRSQSEPVRLGGESIPGLASIEPTIAPATGAQYGSQLTITVTLERSRQKAFERYLHGVQEPGSPLYQHFLSASQQAARFGPGRATYGRVQAWLRSRGLHVVQGSANRLSLVVQGTRAQAERAFETPIRDARSDGRSVYLNLRSPALPPTLAHDVQSVMGLSDVNTPVAGPATQHMCENQGSLANTPGNNAFKKSCANLCRANAEKVLPGSYAELLWEILLLALPPVFSLANTAVNGANGAAGLVGYCFGAAAAQGNPGFGNWVSEHHKEIEYAEKVFSWEPLSDPAKGRVEESMRVAQTAATDTAGKSAGVKPDALPSDPALQKIGLLEFDGFDRTNVTDWLEMEGLQTSLAKRLGEVNVNGGVSTPGAGESEVLLDIDTVLGTAPLSDVVVYDAPASTSFVQMFQTMLEDGDTVISNSWSQCEDQTPLADAQAIDSVLASAAASGVTVLNGTGDDGSSCLDGSPDTIGVPADSPNATSVGGSSPSFGPGLTYGTESWWNEQQDEPAGGAGGFGVSRYFARPSYQEGQTESTMRSVPDITFDADPHAGVSLCQADAGGCPDEELWGGTSMATPGVAALVADLDEELGHDVGDLNDALYPLAGTDAFHTAASMGSDFAHVGLGTPDFTAIYERLAHVSPGSASATTSEAHAAGQPQADGADEGVVRVDLKDANGLPLGGREVELTSTGKAAIASHVASTDSTDGAAVFSVTDTEPETVTFTAIDKSDGVTLDAHPKMTFQTPVATGAEISAAPSVVESNGTAASVIRVYLLNSLGRPAAGKTVKLQGEGDERIDGEADGQPAEATTDAEGDATFTATDEIEQSVGFTATDVSDGNLPVPGGATVTFQYEGGSRCSDALPSAVESPFSFSEWADGLPFAGQDIYVDNVNYGECDGPSAPAFDSSGDAYVADGISGEIYVVGPGGGAYDTADALPDAHFELGQLGGLVFGKEGELYAALVNTEGNWGKPEIVQLNPSTGAIVRVVASAEDGLNDCPETLAVDPLSGDLFASDDCNFGRTRELERIVDPASEHATVEAYTEELPSSSYVASQGIAIAPDGTIYVAMLSAEQVVEVSATNVPATDRKVTTVASPGGYADGLTLASTETNGSASGLYVTSGKSLDLIDLSHNPATVSPVGSGEGDLDLLSLGPEGCTYVNDLDKTLRLSSGSACQSLAAQHPEIALSASGPSPAPTGESVSFTASLANFPEPQGVAVRFVVSGADEQVKLVHANAEGKATFTMTGQLTGQDTVQAFALAGTETIESQPLTQLWSTGRDTSYLSLGASQLGGPIGAAVTLRASLFDESADPTTPIANAQVSLSLEGQSCLATTATDGEASCSVTVPGGVGLEQLTASYAGDSSYTAASASEAFEAGAVGLPGPAIPQVSPSTPGSTPSTSTSPATTTKQSEPSSQPASLCGTVNVDLLDVYVAGGKVTLLGYADPDLAGRQVKIESAWNHRVVATAKVLGNGYFRADAEPPPSRERQTARYQASVGKLRSPALKLTRRLYVYSVTQAGHGQVRITGEVVGPLANPPAKVTVALRDSCATGYKSLKAKVKLDRSNGRFTVLAPAPPSSAPGAVYRLQTRVRADRRSRRTFATDSLPRVVGQ